MIDYEYKNKPMKYKSCTYEEYIDKVCSYDKFFIIHDIHPKLLKKIYNIVEQGSKSFYIFFDVRNRMSLFLCLVNRIWFSRYGDVVNFGFYKGHAAEFKLKGITIPDLDFEFHSDMDNGCRLYSIDMSFLHLYHCESDISIEEKIKSFIPFVDYAIFGEKYMYINEYDNYAEFNNPSKKSKDWYSI